MSQLVLVGNEIINRDHITHIELDNQHRSNPNITIHFVGGSKTHIDGEQEVKAFMYYINKYVHVLKPQDLEIPAEVRSRVAAFKCELSSVASLSDMKELTNES